MKRERSLLLGGRDKMIQMIKRYTRAHRGVVNKAVSRDCSTRHFGQKVLEIRT